VRARKFCKSLDLIGRKRENKCHRPSIVEQIGAYYHVVVQTISLKLPDDLLAQLTSEAKARRVTRSRLVRDSLEKALNEKPSASSVSCYDLARDLAGSVRGLPKDLATNPKYMEDFGK
jgi:Ribbon-helix-helix protein, copG family